MLLRSTLHVGQQDYLGKIGNMLYLTKPNSHSSSYRYRQPHRKVNNMLLSTAFVDYVQFFFRIAVQAFCTGKQNRLAQQIGNFQEDYVRAKTSRRIIRPFIVIAENNWILIYMVELCCMTVIFVGVMVAVFGKTSREPHFTPLHSTK